MREKGVTLKRLIADYLDGLKDGERFSPSDVRDYVVKVTDGERNPMDGTVTRVMRMLREEGWGWSVEDKTRAVYRRTYTTVTRNGKGQSDARKPRPYSYKY